MTLHYAFNKNYKFEKEPTGQTVYEQLQEIQDKIGDKTISYRCNNCDRLYTEDADCFQCTRDMSYSCRQIVEYYPISLSRVLSALDEGNGFPNTSGYVYFQGEIYHQDIYDDGERFDYKMDSSHICSRKLINDDNSDCMLSDQSPETIKAIWEIVFK